MRQRCSARRTLGACWRLLCSLALALLAGCQPSDPGDALHTYLASLAELLDVAPSAIPPLPFTPPPLAGELQLHLTASGPDGIDFLSLSGCAVQATIGKLDSSLGRAAKPSQRLLLALEYLQLAPACIGQLQGRGNAALATALQHAWQEQRAQLPVLIFNATLGSDEYRAFWLATPALGDYPRSSPGAAPDALQAINRNVRRWLSGDYRAQNRDFELRLSEVAGGDGGALLQALSQQSNQLMNAEHTLAQYRTDRLPGTNHQCAAAIINPLTRLRAEFIEEVQPHNTQSIRRYQAYLTPIAALEQQLTATLPRGYRQWMTVRDQRFATGAGLAHQHTAHLEQLLQACTPEQPALSRIVWKIGYTATPNPTRRSAAEE